MTEQRRYRDEEVREIIGLATRGKAADAAALPNADGLTLAELQGIGTEVGLEPEAVAHAAATFDARAMVAPRRTSFGMPIQVGRVVQLPRTLTDREWEQLVAELRTTFGARGRVATHGGLREWVNGNLHACIEPVEGGYRLRLGTMKSDALALNLLGATGLTTGAVAFGGLLMSGGLPEAVFVPSMIAASGVAAFLANMLRLPRWAERREQQMEYIATRVAAIVQTPPDDEAADRPRGTDDR